MAWLFLFLVGVLEIGWALGLKYTYGFSRLLGIALRSIPLGTGYAIWSCIGTIGTVTFGIAFLAEPATAGRRLCVLLILSGIVGLKLLSSH